MVGPICQRRFRRKFLSGPFVAKEECMPKRRLIVHLGLHKTGTTTIQQYLATHTYGLFCVEALYPCTGRHPLASTQHALLASGFFSPDLPGGVFGLKGPVDVDLVTRALLHEIELAGLPTVILSSEEFSRFDAGVVRHFARTFSDFDIVPIAFLRNLVDAFEAYYGTFIRYTDSALPPDPDSMMPTDLLDPFRAWAEVAADGRITVVDYDASVSGNSVQDFCDAVGLVGPWLPDSSTMPRLNPSLPPSWTALARELREIGIADHHIAGLVDQLGAVPIRERQTVLSAHMREQLQERYEKAHRELRAAEHVRWIGTSDTPRPCAEAIEVNGLAGAVLALGRALASASDGSSESDEPDELAAPA